MSIRRPGARRAASAVVTALAAGGLVLSASPAAAIPFEGVPDPAGCRQLLLRAAEWPGRASDNTRLVSDGYVSYLATRPECVEPRS